MEEEEKRQRRGREVGGGGMGDKRKGRKAYNFMIGKDLVALSLRLDGVDFRQVGADRRQFGFAGGIGDY